MELPKELEKKIMRENIFQLSQDYFEGLREKGETKWSYPDYVMFIRDHFLKMIKEYNEEVRD